MPRDNQVEGRLVLHRHGARPVQEITLGCLPFPIPLVLARETPDGIRRALRAAVLLDQARSYGGAHLLIDRRRVFAAQAVGFKEALTDRGDADTVLGHAVLHDGLAHGWIVWCIVLDGLQSM